MTGRSTGGVSGPAPAAGSEAIPAEMRRLLGSRLRVWMVRFAEASGWLSFVRPEVVSGYLSAAAMYQAGADSSQAQEPFRIRLTVRKQRIKRIVDLCLSTVLLIATVPLFALIALAIAVESRGPVFVVFQRIGRNGTRFRLLKFRTMVADTEKVRAALDALNRPPAMAFRLSNDPRVTRIGRWLRRSSLDELPQLLNVLLGDMSLVGPRSYPVFRTDDLTAQRTADFKPGITGLWHIQEEVITGFRKGPDLDLEYARAWSVAFDLKILLASIYVQFTGRPVELLKRPVPTDGEPLNLRFYAGSPNRPKSVHRGDREVSKRDEEWIQVAGTEGFS